MTETPWYDSQEGIRTKASTIAGVLEIVVAREKAAASPGTKLQEFVIFDRWRLAADGGLWTRTGGPEEIAPTTDNAVVKMQDFIFGDRSMKGLSWTKKNPVRTVQGIARTLATLA